MQLRDLGRFLTCEPCRRRNTKSNRRRSRAQNLNPPPSHAILTDHIQRRQQATGKKERGFTGYRAITVDDYIREPTQEEELELQDRQQRRENGKAERRVWEVRSKELSREYYLKRGEPEGEFEAWWEEREERIKREREKQREVERGRREMKRDTERWIKLAVREDQEREGGARERGEAGGRAG